MPDNFQIWSFCEPVATAYYFVCSLPGKFFILCLIVTQSNCFPGQLLKEPFEAKDERSLLGNTCLCWAFGKNHPHSMRPSLQFKSKWSKYHLSKSNNSVQLTSLGSCFSLDFAVVIPYSLISFSVLLRRCFLHFIQDFSF